jgi:hypothetical protein
VTDWVVVVDAGAAAAVDVVVKRSQLEWRLLLIRASKTKSSGVAERQFMAGRASIMTALTASCLVAGTARADDLAAAKRRSALIDTLSK